MAELPDNSVVSETAALSDLTSTSASGVSSSASSLKVLRIAQQIKSLKLSSFEKKPTECTINPSMEPTGKQDQGTPSEKEPLPALGTKCKGHEAVALILQKAKNRRLALANGKNDQKENRPPCEALAECSHSRGKGAPDFVTC